MTKLNIGENDLATLFPEIAAQWHPTKNGSLTPEQFLPGSGKSIWWICPKDSRHEWQAVIAWRTNGSGCGVCHGQTVMPGVNDLASTNPELAAQWHPTKNLELLPTQVTVSSSKKVWWVCPVDIRHEWLASVASRSTGHGCGVCRGTTVIEGVNDLDTQNPELGREWDFKKNHPLLPKDVSPKSGKKVWWVCSKVPRHVWETKVASRTSGRGCPYCSNSRVIPGINDLATTHPQIALEWHPTKNADASPTEFSAGSNKRAWWLCAKDNRHEWETPIGSRLAGTGCPICSGRVVLAGVNDLATIRPDLAEQWNQTLNKNLSPNEVTVSSSKRAWWTCPKDPRHYWEATVASRNSGRGCAVCHGLSVLPGVNDLETKNPELARQWHPTKNGDEKPSTVTPSSNKQVWWICDVDSRHEWKADVSSRAAGQGCSVCSGNTVIAGVNDLATKFPEVAKQWHPTKNQDLLPNSVAPRAHRKVWWVCKADPRHEWQADIANMTNGQGCSVCHGLTVMRGINDLETLFPEIASQWHPTLNGDLQPFEVTSSNAKNIWWICPIDPNHVWRSKLQTRTGPQKTGCPSCAKTGFDQNLPSVLYFIGNSEFRARKVGITNLGRKNDRLNNFKKAGWSIISTYESQSGLAVLEVETKLLRWLRDDMALPQYLSKDEMKATSGATETFGEEGPSNIQVMSAIEKFWAESIPKYVN